MSFSEFKMIIDQVHSYISSIFLWNYGEPFLNKELTQMIRYAAARGMYVKASTNGQFFESREFCQELVKSGLHAVTVSFDGADQETIDKFKVNCRFDKTLNGLKLLCQAKSELHSKLPEVALQFIIMKHNEHQREQMKRLARDLRVDIYYEKTFHIYGEDTEFQDMAKEFLPGDLSFSRYRLGKNGIFSLKGNLINRCRYLSSTMVINSNGLVVPCPYDRHSEYIMGNVFKENLREILKKEKYLLLGKKINADRKMVPVCNLCPEGRGDLGTATKLRGILT
jgi:radical SAM protein with 4Fe4S-binding SPASM domain